MLNYMLLTVVVNGHNCVAVRCRMVTNDNATKHAAQIEPSGKCVRQRTVTHCV